MSTIVLVLPVSQVSLSEGRGVATATVTNKGPAAESVVLGAFPPVAPASGATASAAAWTSVDRPQRELASGTTEQFTVTFAPPAGTAAGSYAVRLIAYSAYGAPEESVDQARQLEVIIPAAGTPPPPPPPVRWWVYAIAAGLILVVGVVAFLLLRSGPSCPDGSCTSTSPITPSPSVVIEDITWVVTSIRESDMVTVPVAELTLRIEGDRVAGSAACNKYFGDWKRDGNLVQVTNLQTTLILCQPAQVQQQASTFLDILSSATSFESDEATLELRTADDRALRCKRA